jgi:hypothetical protein
MPTTPIQTTSTRPQEEKKKTCIIEFASMGYHQRNTSHKTDSPKKKQHQIKIKQTVTVGTEQQDHIHESASTSLPARDTNAESLAMEPTVVNKKHNTR